MSLMEVYVIPIQSSIITDCSLRGLENYVMLPLGLLLIHNHFQAQVTEAYTISTPNLGV